MSLIRPLLRRGFHRWRALGRRVFHLARPDYRSLETEGNSLYLAERRAVAGLLYARTRGKVFAGPFSQMRVPLNAYFESCPPFIVGSHEEELHPQFYALVNATPSRIVNIGAAEGYYAVGLAHLLPDCPVLAYETIPECQQVIRDLAEQNDVADRLELAGTCDAASLQGSLTRNSLLLIDCEGAEAELLDPEKVPALRTTRMICELHDFYVPGLTRTLIRRFRATHHLTLIEKQARQADRYGVLDGLTPTQKFLALHENRYVGTERTHARYMVLTPHHT